MDRILQGRSGAALKKEGQVPNLTVKAGGARFFSAREIEVSDLSARAAGRTAWGHYFYAAGSFYRGFQAVGKAEAYKAWGAAAQRWASFGLNYLFYEKNKLMAEYRFRTDRGSKTPEFRLQLQAYFK